jgi:hypothetical protein
VELPLRKLRSTACPSCHFQSTTPALNGHESKASLMASA